MTTAKILACVAVMAVVTYLPRMLPLAVFRKKNCQSVGALFPGIYAVCSSGRDDFSGSVLFN